MTWLLVDDSHGEAATYAEQLTLDDVIAVAAISVADFLDRLPAGLDEVSGVLMDVDLSNEAGIVTTGPGVAQSIRDHQQAGETRSFPIIRFSAPDKVEKFIGSSGLSDDVFDLLIDKAGFVARLKRNEIRDDLLSTEAIYRAFNDGASLLDLLSIDEDRWQLWGHQELYDRVERAERGYQKSLLIAHVLAFPGLLIDEDLLAIRLGVDRQNSKEWDTLLEKLDCIKYTGTGSQHVARWWARGLNDWWTEELQASRPLSGTSISDRIATLSKHFSGLEALQMPPQSLGDRPWRTCKLSELSGEGIVPVDPSKAVRMTSGISTGAWMDQNYAALGPALQNRDDPRLIKSDLKRLEPLARAAR